VIRRVRIVYRVIIIVIIRVSIIVIIKVITIVSLLKQSLTNLARLHNLSLIINLSHKLLQFYH